MLRSVLLKKENNIHDIGFKLKILLLGTLFLDLEDRDTPLQVKKEMDIALRSASTNPTHQFYCCVHLGTASFRIRLCRNPLSHHQEHHAVQ